MRALKHNGDQRPFIECVVCNTSSRSYHRACKTCQDCSEKISNRQLEINNELFNDIEYLNNVIKVNLIIYGGTGLRNQTAIALFELEQFKKKSA